MTSATKAELAALHIMAQEAVYIRIILDKMRYPQPPTPLQTDNSMADKVVNGKITPKRTKALGPRMPSTILHILAARQTQLRRLLVKASHQAKHHQNVRREFLTPPIVVEMLQQENANYAAAAA